VSLAGRELSVTSEALGGRLEVAVGGERRELAPGCRCTFTLNASPTVDDQPPEVGHAIEF
jgi:hypothetical protein